MKKRVLLVVVVVVVTTCFISCADIFSASKRGGITVTIPAFSASSNNSRAVNTDSTFSNWNVYAFLISKDIMSENLALLAKATPSTSGLKNLVGVPGILDAVEYKGVNLAYDMLVQFKRVKPSTECFVYLAITYEERIVFYGWGPRNAVILQDSGTSGSTSLVCSLGSLHMVQAGVNNIGLVLKKNRESPVYFYSQDGTPDASGASVTPQMSTPRKPAAVNDSSKPLKNMGNGGVAVLTGDVALSENITITNRSSILSVPGSTHKLTLETGKIELNDSSTLSLVDVTLACARVEMKSDSTLELNGNVAVGNGASNGAIVFEESSSSSSSTYGKIIVAGPLQKKVGTLTFDYDNGNGANLINYYKSNPIIIDAGIMSNPKNFFNVNVENTNPVVSSEPFTYEFKRNATGNGWNLFITVNP